MLDLRRKGLFRGLHKKNIFSWIFLISIIFLFRLTQGAIFFDAYAQFVKPFLLSSSKQDWIISGVNLENQIKIKLLEKDNQRLRNLLSLKMKDKNI